jgi:ABC-type transporter Mla MlaB component
MGETRIWSVEQDDEDIMLRLELPELNLEMREAFAEEMRNGLARGNGTVTFDLTELKRIYSMFLGILMDGVWQAKKQNRPIRIILNKGLYDHFIDLGIQNAAELVCMG